MTRPQPRHCPVCGKQHSDPVTLTCWACITSDVEDTSLIEPSASESYLNDDGPTYDGPPNDEEGNRIAYDMLYGDEPDFDPGDTQPMPVLFDEDDEND